MNRRKFIGSVAVTGSIALSGCLAESASTSLTQAPEDAVTVKKDKSSNSEIVYKASGHLEKGEFGAMSLGGKLNFKLDWTLDASSPIDIWVLEQKEMDAFRDGGEISYFQGVSKSGVKSGNASGTVPFGKHILIWENSGAFETTPESAVDFDATVRLSLG
ncbi:hypothetical protein [Haladaptatus sp. NG-WS-4]